MKHRIHFVWYGALLATAACTKKPPKPMRTEPWLAHPVPSVVARQEAGLATRRYAIGAASVIRFEVPAQRGPLRGSISRITGEIELDSDDLSRSRARVQADLGSLTVQESVAYHDADLLARLRTALDLGDPGPATSASFELTLLESLSSPRIEPAPESDARAAFTRRVRGVAVGNLLLHGFRVQRRAPLEVSFSFDGDPRIPQALSIRSPAPFVVSLETHAIAFVRPSESTRKGPERLSAAPREALVSVEIYGTIVD